MLCYTCFIGDVSETVMEKIPRSLQPQISEAVRILKIGGVIAYPTDTVYGLGAAMNIPTAIERIYEIKGRPKDMALPLLLSDESQIGMVTHYIPDSARKLAKAFLPGALTIILIKSTNVPDMITSGSSGIAFRIPNHSIPLAIIKELGVPIVGTSANLSGQPAAVTADDVYRQIGQKIDLLIDGGQCPGGIESTVIDLTTPKPLIRRQGAVSFIDLKKILPDILPA